ncbi:MAG: hypothetical protein WC955_00055 [Elusimicrobiota bacterium]
METREILQNIIDKFDLQRLKRLFSEKNSKFRPSEESFGHYDTGNFSGGMKLGELSLDDGVLLVCAFEAKFEAKQELSERSGKKAQYELGKKILKETQSDAGIFVFYDIQGSFRFSLIYANYLGTKRDWSAFRRFTYFVGNGLTNKTFKQRIGDGDFSSLKDIKDAFSVEKVTEEFYEDIANWYFWAVEHCQFPKDAETEDNGRNIAVIRLITRIIFIWFMRERGLVPKVLFDKEIVGQRLKNLSPDESTYYHAILQNLFFATLNTPKDKRKFTDENRGNQGYNKDFGNHSLFRYQECFKEPDKLKDYFDEIPFLNGGLFECLDNKEDRIYIDGFTRTKQHQPTVPNFLFFSPEEEVDLTNAYGPKGKNRKVRGLLDTLSSFNFTIDENSPDDADIALDPELLGRVFENLLASFNPETSTTARKATGSYYTPREIVDYMVAESLKAYFKTHLVSIDGLDNKISRLFSIDNGENPFNAPESKKLVELIESVRIVDPAVGSGAFPMGALNKLVFILNKVDPGNELWKHAQLAAADTIPDLRIKQDTKNRIEEYFEGKNTDYGRKLFLIQKCIYGVDIQQIAVEIAKLRFFIALLVDERIERAKDNFGIQPLPNLDFKIMQGNSLLEEYEGIQLFDERLLSRTSKQEIIDKISALDLRLKGNYSQRLKYYENNPDWMKKKCVDKPAELKLLEKNTEDLNSDKEKLVVELESYGQDELALDKRVSAKPIGDELKRLHKEFFETNEKEIKDKLKKQIETMEWELIEVTLKEHNKTAELKKLERFKKSNTRPYFLWKLHFADVFENGGFDVVIGNPPYGVEFSEYEKNVLDAKFNEWKSLTKNSAIYFIYLSNILINKNGVNSFIVPKSLCYSLGWNQCAKFILSGLHKFIDTGKAFEQVKLEQVIFIRYKNTNKPTYVIGVYDGSKIVEYENIEKTIFCKYKVLLTGQYPKEFVLIKKVLSKFHNTFGEYVSIDRGLNWQSKVEKYSGKTPVYRGAQLSPYFLEKSIDFIDLNKFDEGEYAYLLKPKILNQLAIAHVKNPYPHFYIQATLDLDNRVVFETISCTFVKNPIIDIKLLLALNNSKLFAWLLYKFVYSNAIRSTRYDEQYVGKIPTPKLEEATQKPFIEIVDKILAITKSSDYLENLAEQDQVKEYEKQIDQMVYKLYDLTDEEIDIIEGNKI